MDVTRLKSEVVGQVVSRQGSSQEMSKGRKGPQDISRYRAGTFKCK
jgi:hypothetical protein